MRCLLAAGLVASLVGCGSDAATSSASSKSSTTQAGTAANVAIKGTTITWTAPTSFQLIPSPMPMRLATYKITRAEGDPEDAEMTVSRVGGDLEKNIQRWRDQLKGGTERESSTSDVGEMKVTILWIEGTFSGMSPMGGASAPKENFALLGAVVQDKKGDPHFFKLTGPKKTVEAARAAFDELIQSIAPKT